MTAPPGLRVRRPAAAIPATVAGTSAATRAEWQETYDRCESATFFHGPLWSDIWAAYSDGRFQPAPLRVHFADGSAAIVGVTNEHTRYGVTQRHLSPGGCYGGWVSSRPLTEAQADEVARIVVSERSFSWRASPADSAALLRCSHAASADVTHVIDLRDGGEAARARWSPSARNKVRRAQKARATVREGKGTSDWGAYAALYQEAVTRWGERASVVYRPSLFRQLALLDSAEVRLWLVEVDGVPCAGDVVFLHGTHAVDWHGASAPSRCPGARNLLQWQLCEELADAGIETYDLNPSGGHGGVASFKASLGAEPKPAPSVRRRHVLQPLAERVRPLVRRNRR